MRVCDCETVREENRDPKWYDVCHFWTELNRKTRKLTQQHPTLQCIAGESQSRCQSEPRSENISGENIAADLWSENSQRRKKKMFIESPTETRTSARAPLFCCCVCAKRVRFHSRDYKIEFRLYFIFQIQQPSALHRHITSSKTQRFSFESRARSSKKKTSSAHFEIVYLKQQHRQTQNSVEKRSNNNTIYVTSRVREMKKKNCLSDFTCVYKSLSWAELLFFLFVGVRCRCREDVDKQNWRIQSKRVRETSSICIHRNLIKLKPGNIAETSNRLANTQQPRKKNHSDQQQCDQAAKRLKV